MIIEITGLPGNQKIKHISVDIAFDEFGEVETVSPALEAWETVPPAIDPVKKKPVPMVEVDQYEPAPPADRLIKEGEKPTIPNSWPPKSTPDEMKLETANISDEMKDITF